MSNLDFSQYTSPVLIDALRILRDYKSSLRQVGKRAKLTDIRHPDTLIPMIEYAPWIDQQLLRKYAESMMKQYFPDYTGPIDHLVYQEQLSLISGIRVRYGDDLVDLTFQKFGHLFQK